MEAAKSPAESAEGPKTEGDRVAAQNEAFDIAESMQAAAPAAEPVYGRNWCDYTAADDTPSKSRMNRIRLEQGEPVAVAQDSVDGVFRTMPDSATFEDYRDALAVGTLTAVDQMAFYNLLHDHLAEAEASLAACRADAERLDALRDNSWDLRCFDTFGGEDVGWKVMEHHQAEPLEREVAIVFTDDPRAAIDAARSQP